MINKANINVKELLSTMINIEPPIEGKKKEEKKRKKRKKERHHLTPLFYLLLESI